MGPAASGLALKRVDHFRCVGLRKGRIKSLASFLAKRLQIGRLGAGHGLLACGPIVGILLRIGWSIGLGGRFLVRAHTVST
jgi:hypothetical protein